MLAAFYLEDVVRLLLKRYGAGQTRVQEKRAWLLECRVVVGVCGRTWRSKLQSPCCKWHQGCHPIVDLRNGLHYERDVDVGCRSICFMLDGALCSEQCRSVRRADSGLSQGFGVKILGGFLRPFLCVLAGELCITSWTNPAAMKR